MPLSRKPRRKSRRRLPQWPSRRRTSTTAVIRSPIDGVVVARNVDVGQTVAASLQAPTIFTIAQDLTKMQLYAKTDESDVGRVRVHQNVSFKVDAFPKETFTGTVSEIRMNATTVQNVVTYDAVIDSRESRLRVVSRDDRIRVGARGLGQERHHGSEQRAPVSSVAAAQRAAGPVHEVRHTATEAARLQSGDTPSGHPSRERPERVDRGSATPSRG